MSVRPNKYSRKKIWYFFPQNTSSVRSNAVENELNLLPTISFLSKEKKDRKPPIYSPSLSVPANFCFAFLPRENNETQFWSNRTGPGQIAQFHSKPLRLHFLYLLASILFGRSRRRSGREDEATTMYVRSFLILSFAVLKRKKDRYCPLNI